MVRGKKMLAYLLYSLFFPDIYIFLRVDSDSVSQRSDYMLNAV